ncbi:MAG: hypothetical protein QM784_03895 [Polyangiaceae bacterium]
MTEQRYWEPELETLSREALQRLQFERLREHLAFAYANSPYYRRTFDAAGVRPSSLSHLEDLARFPFIDKQIRTRASGGRSRLG